MCLTVSSSLSTINPIKKFSKFSHSKKNFFFRNSVVFLLQSIQKLLRNLLIDSDSENLKSQVQRKYLQVQKQ